MPAKSVFFKTQLSNSGNLTDGINRLCIEDLLLGDPNCTDNPKSGALRTAIDPK